jgi:hypothetical protein
MVIPLFKNSILTREKVYCTLHPPVVPCIEPVEPKQHFHTLSLRSILMLSSPICSRLHSGFLKFFNRNCVRLSRLLHGSYVIRRPLPLESYGIIRLPHLILSDPRFISYLRFLLCHSLSSPTSLSLPSYIFFPPFSPFYLILRHKFLLFSSFFFSLSHFYIIFSSLL